MIASSKVYNILTVTYLLSLLAAGIGFSLSYFGGGNFLGNWLARTGVVVGLFAFIVSMIVWLFKKRLKFIKFED